MNSLKNSNADRLLWAFNLNPPLKLFSFPRITASNNLPHRIFYESIVKMLWT